MNIINTTLTSNAFFICTFILYLLHTHINVNTMIMQVPRAAIIATPTPTPVPMSGLFRIAWVGTIGPIRTE